MSATVTPVRSASVWELTTGVSRITPAPAAAARRTSSERDRPLQRRLVSPKRDHRVHLDLGAPRQRLHADRDPRRRAGFKERGVDLVDGGEAPMSVR